MQFVCEETFVTYVLAKELELILARSSWVDCFLNPFSTPLCPHASARALELPGDPPIDGKGS